MVGVLVLAHWFACVWRLQASFQPSMLDSWLGKDHVYCQPDDSGPSGVACMGATQLYVAALYWASTTITSVGYGDITPTPGNLTCSSPPSASLGLSASPHLASLPPYPHALNSLHLLSHFSSLPITSLHFPFHLTSHTFSGLAGNTSEQAVALALLLLGSVAWGLVLATIVSVLSHIDRDGDEFTSTMSELNKMMIRQGLPNGMRTRRVAQTRRGRASYLVTHALSRTYPTAPFASHLAIMACANYPTGCESIFTSLGTSVCMPSRLSSLASCHPRCRAR